MRRQPNSILKSPTEHGDDSIPIPLPTQGLMNVRRRVSFGPQQIHEFSVETTYSHVTTDSSLAATYSLDSVQQQNTPHSRVSLGESMEFTCIDAFSQEDPICFQNQKQSSDLQPTPAQRVHCGRDLPVLQPTRVPLLEKPTQRNNTLPYEHIQDHLVQHIGLYDSKPGDHRDAQLFVQENNVYQKYTSRKINYSDVSMEFTLMDKQNALSAVVQETEQPVHLYTQNPVHNTSRMSWLNYSQNNVIDKVDESAQTTLNDSPITSSILKPIAPINFSFRLPSTEQFDKIRYEQYLDYKRKISKLHPQVAKLLQEVEALTATKDTLQKEYSDEVTQVEILKKKLADTKSAIRDKRAAIQLDVTSRLQSIKGDPLSS